MAGRPNIPAHIKKKRGTFRDDREPNAPISYERLTELPSVPENIPPPGDQYFLDCCESLLESDNLSAAILKPLLRASLWYVYMTRAAEKIEEFDFVQKAQSGYTNINGYLTAFEKSHKWLWEFEREYGLTLASSQRMNMGQKKKGSGLLK